VTTFGTGKISDEKIEALIQEHFDLRPKGIVQMLDLLRPIYQPTAAYGHFGRKRADRSPGKRSTRPLRGCSWRPSTGDSYRPLTTDHWTLFQVRPSEERCSRFE
jgi:hypothetical protein